MLVCLWFESIGRRKRQDGRPGTRQLAGLLCFGSRRIFGRITRHSQKAEANRSERDKERETTFCPLIHFDQSRQWFPVQGAGIDCG